MPANNEQAGSVAQPEQNAQTDQGQMSDVGRQTSEKKSSHIEAVKDHLDVPEEIWAQIKPKAETEGGEAAGSQTPEVGGQQDGDGGQQEGDASHRDAATTEGESEADGEQLPEEEIQAPQGRKLTKEQKRINKLVRQRNEAERTAEAATAENQQFREYFAKLQQGQAEQNAVPVPGATGPLARVATETQLNTEVARAKALREWCDANAEGVTVGEGDKQEFHDPNKIAAWRREAEKILTDAPERRDQIRGFTQAQQVYNQAAFAAMPKMFDRQSEEHQLATAILQELPPQARSHPGINLFLADWVRGFQARKAENGHQTSDVGQQNGATNGHKRAIDDRAFAPRVPLAPHTDISTTRGNGPSPQKKVDAAMQNILDDPDGSAGAIAQAFAARDANKRSNKVAV